MATVDITGRITDASGRGVLNVPVRLVALPEFEGWAEIVDGTGVIIDRPVEVTTDANGYFLIKAVHGVQYRIVIEAIGLDQPFRAPATGSVGFHLLGLAPRFVGATAREDETDPAVTVVALAVATEPAGTVLERFDSLVVERSTTGANGPYVELDTIDLVAGQPLYNLEDPAGGEDFFYRAYYLDTASGDVSEASDPLSGATFATAALVMTVQEFKDVYLFGIDLTDEEGNPYPPLMFEWAIRAANDFLEKALDIKIVAHEVVDEAHDHYPQNYQNWNWLSLFEYPVIRVNSLTFSYPGGSTTTIDPEWVQLMDGGAHGLIQMVPGTGAASSMLLLGGSHSGLWGGERARVPSVWKVSYRAGFEVADIPYDIKHVVGMIASLALMNVAGDLVGGSGLQGWSVGLPGLNQSVTTTNSSTNAGFGARVIEYMKEIKWMLPTMKAFYGKSSKITVA